MFKLHSSIHIIKIKIVSGILHWYVCPRIYIYLYTAEHTKVVYKILYIKLGETIKNEQGHACKHSFKGKSIFKVYYIIFYIITILLILK